VGRREIVDREGLRRLAGAVVAILARQGVRVEHEGAWQALRQAGSATLDESEHVARFPESAVAAFLEGRPDRNRHHLEHRPAATYGVSLGFEIDPYFYDYPTRTARLGTRADVVAMTALGEVLPEVGEVGAAVVMNDVDPRLEAVESLVTVALHTGKPVSAVSLYPQENRYFADVATILYGEGQSHRYIGTGGFLTSPMTLGARVGDLMFAAKEWGVAHASAATMAIAGMTAPITPVGCAAMGAAEILGGWLVAQAVNPALGSFSGGTATGMLDMRTMRACFGTPECALQDALIRLVFEQEFGGGIGISGPGYTDAQVPGLQCVYEKMSKGMTIQAVCGYPLHVGNPGIVDAGRTFSPVQFMLDLDVDRSLWQFDHGVAVNDETLGLEAVWESGLQSGSGYVCAEHTLRHYRSDVWYPRLIDRRTDLAQGGGDEAGILARAEEAWRAAVARYEQPEMDPAKVRALNEVVERARRELL
jgi:trimethylamine---corrinoid protein Co-methyltransferase